MNAAANTSADAPADWGPLSALPGHPLMWVLIASELAVFGLALLGYAGARAKNPLAFALEQDGLNRLAGVANTALLPTSGCFAALGNHAAHEGRVSRARKMLAAAGVLGLGFLIVKGFEYAGEIAAGHDIDSSPFFTLYFLVTGFHALHVVLGLVIGSLATAAAVETGTAFWHMVDLIWLVADAHATPLWLGVATLAAALKTRIVLARYLGLAATPALTGFVAVTFLVLALVAGSILAFPTPHHPLRAENYSSTQQ